ncbi:hypothetical protein BH09BAC2_BH09BAC2_09710 [soil metagenome]
MKKQTTWIIYEGDIIHDSVKQAIAYKLQGLVA